MTNVINLHSHTDELRTLVDSEKVDLATATHVGKLAFSALVNLTPDVFQWAMIEIAARYIQTSSDRAVAIAAVSGLFGEKNGEAISEMKVETQ